jgi:hypothetical protein
MASMVEDTQVHKDSTRFHARIFTADWQFYVRIGSVALRPIF